jgi:hypothetical protein
MIIFKRIKKYKSNSEITLEEILAYINNFNPIKVTFNDLVLYNDYDSEIEIEDGVYGEMLPLLKVVPDRIKNFKNSIVHSINIDIVQYHHSVIEIKGEQKKSK